MMVVACIGVCRRAGAAFRVHARERRVNVAGSFMKTCELPSPAQPTLRRGYGGQAGESRNAPDDRGVRLLSLSPADHAESAGAAPRRHGSGSAAAGASCTSPGSHDRSLGGGNLARLSAGALRPTPQTPSRHRALMPFAPVHRIGTYNPALHVVSKPVSRHRGP